MAVTYKERLRVNRCRLSGRLRDAIPGEKKKLSMRHLTSGGYGGEKGFSS